MKKAISAIVLTAALACLSIVALASNFKVNERITFKKGETKVELKGELSKSQKSYVYLFRAEKGQSVNLAAVFRDNFSPVLDVRGVYKSEDADTPLVGSAKNGKWSGTITESGDYLIVVSLPDNDDQPKPYQLGVSLQ